MKAESEKKRKGAKYQNVRHREIGRENRLSELSSDVLERTTKNVTGEGSHTLKKGDQGHQATSRQETFALKAPSENFAKEPAQEKVLQAC